MNLKRDQRGQAFVVTVLMIASLLGLTALVLDVGSWFRAHRQLQAIELLERRTGPPRLC